MRERENQNERKRIHRRHRSKPPRRCCRSPNHHAITVDLQSILLMSIFNPRRSERDNKSEREERERKMWNEREEWLYDWKKREWLCWSIFSPYLLKIFFFFWVLLVDCVGVSELIMILYIFLLVWMLRKWNKRQENLEFLIFWEQLFLTKIFNIFILKLLITKILFYFKI